jgi:protein involved in polysaccharide export with SLBB domain
MKPTPLHHSALRWSRCLVLLAGGVLAHAAGPAAAPAVVITKVSTLDLGDYHIAPRDNLQFQVFEEADSLLVQRVSSDGVIAVPLLGSVKVSGMTLREAETSIEKRYREGGFYLKPQVILSFDSYAPRSVSVLGQVNNPNQIDFSIERGDIGILTAITRAGGFTRVAQTDAIKVIRTTEGKETTITVNITAYLNDKSSTQQFKLLPDDIVFVPERVF